MKEKLTVLVSTRCRPELSLALLSLLQQNFSHWKLNLVYGDLGNSIGTINEKILRIVQETHEVRLFRFDKGTNFLANLNIVIDQVTTKYSMRLDDDIALRPDYLSELISFLNRREVGAVTGFVETMSSDFWVGPGSLKDISVLKEKFINDFDFDKGLSQPLYHRGHIPPDIFRRRWYYSGTFPTDAVLFNTNVLQMTKFDPNLARPHFCDDIDLSFNIRQKGYRIVFVPSARCIHLYAKDKKRIRDSVKEKLLFDYLRRKWTRKATIHRQS